MFEQHHQKTLALFLTAYSSQLQSIAPFILLMQTTNFLILSVHLLTVVVIQIVDLSTLLVIVPLSSTEHVATDQKQITMDIIHMLN